MGALLQRVARWGERRLPALTRYRRAEVLPIELHRRRIYIVPTGFGTGFALLLLVMLAGALNYANNAALMLTCLLGAASATSMLVAFRNLDGLVLRQLHAGHAVAGEPLELTFDLDSPRARSAIRLDLGSARHAFALSAGSVARVTVAMATTHRGRQALPRMRIWTTWPLGMFRAWSWLHPDQSVLVWPRAELAGPPPQAQGNHSELTTRQPGEELSALREYRPGDPQRHIAWKISAHHEGLLVKEFAQPQRQRQWHLDWRQMPGLDAEVRIARLARWLGEAQAQRIECSLWLPGEEIAPGSGPHHYAQCMDALATLP
ncbi:MAG: DUF58 domain-containing protein [Rhodanobacter sp.]